MSDQPEKFYSPQGRSWKSYISGHWAEWAEERIAELEARIARMQPYIAHKDDCATVLVAAPGGVIACDCGAAELGPVVTGIDWAERRG